MSTNALDDIVRAAQQTWTTHGVAISPLSISVTLFILALPLILIFIFALSQKEEPLPPPPGCKKIGIEGKGNLSDQYAKKYSKGGPQSAANPWKVKAIFIYPIKSCKGIELANSEVVRTGLQYDRQFTLAQHVTGLPTLEGKVQSEWKFVTLRTFPRLAQVETEFWVPDPEAHSYSTDNEWVKSKGCIIIRFPFSPDADFSLEGLRVYGKLLAARLTGHSEPMVEVRIPYDPNKERIKKMHYTHEQVKIWKDTPLALNMSSEIPDEVMDKLRYTLGVTNPLALFRIDTEKYRPVFKCAPKREDVGFQPQIGMADSYPIHIMNLSAIHSVSSHLPHTHPARLHALRYRANVYLTGPPPFDEDSWTKARIGTGIYHISCRTTRCKLPNVDPETGLADKDEPGTTMRKYRVIDEGSASSCLGMQVTPLVGDEGAVVGVGDAVEVLERGNHHFLKV